MPGPRDPLDGASECGKRIDVVRAELLALLAGGRPDTPPDLVVQLDALIQDAQELAVRAADSVARLKDIGDQVTTQRRVLERAIGDARQAFKELAAAGGPPSRSLLVYLSRAMDDIQRSAAELGRLGHEHTDAVSRATLDPREDAAPPPSITPAPGVREAADPGGIVRAPRFAEEPAPPGTTIQPPYGDDQLRGPISPPF